jgi:uncharacterized protein
MTTASDTSLSAVLHGCQFGRLTTFRKSGAAVPTPIWFAEHDGKAVFLTGPSTGKVTRMRRNPQVTLGPATVRGNPKGPEVSGTARVLSGDEAADAHDLLLAKYGLQFRLLQLIQLITRAEPIYFEVMAD